MKKWKIEYEQKNGEQSAIIVEGGSDIDEEEAARLLLIAINNMTEPAHYHPDFLVVRDPTRKLGKSSAELNLGGWKILKFELVQSNESSCN